MAAVAWGDASKLVRDRRLGKHERLAWNPDHTLIRPTIGRRRQLICRLSDVRANHGKVAVLKFPDVRAALAAGGCRAVGVRVRADAFQEHAQLLL